MKSLDNRGVFQLMKKVTQPAIARENWATNGSLVMHRINHHLCPACCQWIGKYYAVVQDVTAYYLKEST